MLGNGDAPTLTLAIDQMLNKSCSRLKKEPRQRRQDVAIGVHPSPAHVVQLLRNKIHARAPEGPIACFEHATSHISYADTTSFCRCCGQTRRSHGSFGNVAV
ncbi:uncharacterized protein PHALS_06312 [Plasmopara halstedii]|uniref:Uncharacterized protein n=1 Tax=Plasmopara halstedii TaxID=4781 RepID=A0A0P1B1D1_PLAHL|nr:uncharacterized protein PHALS_06312 [Plasmopara halstedii]CEG48493.1 hypothetical protein PHALS_06312 [Plasmopara halstedii]|eukprot:XP_024584862.1 hypothetical protein PHALS_06312 [Plasmopara halstedii]